MRKVAAIVLVILFVISIITAAYAEVAVPYASRVFNGTKISVGCSGGKVTALARVEASDIASKLGVKSLSIQVLNGSTWVTLTSVSGKYSYDVKTYSKTISCNATSGKQYRAKVTFYGTVNGVSETLSLTSSTKTAP